jgi:tetratricopeptide (TPR) repeat protein
VAAKHASARSEPVRTPTRRVAARTGARQRPAKRPDQPKTEWPHAWEAASVLGLFALLAWVIYSPVLRGPFVFDDIEIQSSRILQPSSVSDIASLLTSPGIPRRISRATLAFNFRVGGLDPYGYHLVGLVLHVLNGMLVFLLAVRLMDTLAEHHSWRQHRLPVAVAASLIWLVHPVNTQAVAYVWQRSTLLGTFFFLGALIAYLAGRSAALPQRRLLWGMAVVSGVLAVGSKENAATLPLVVVLLEWLFPRGERSLRSRSLVLGAVAAFVAMAAVFLGPRFLDMLRAQYADRGFTLEERLLTELRVVVYYVTLLVWPHPSRLQLDYDFTLSRSLFSPSATASCLGLLLAALGVAAASVRRRPLLSLAILWFLGNLAIESTVIPLDLVYEHRLYLPSIVPIIGFVGLVFTRVLVTPRSRLWVAPVAVLMVVWSADRARLWADPILLFEDNARKAKAKARVHNYLGQAYLAGGRALEAKAAFERTLALDPGYVAALNSLAFVHLNSLGDAAAARRLLETALERDPKAGFALSMNLGILSLRLQDYPAAARHFEHAAALEPEDPNPAYHLASSYLRAGDHARAAEVVRDAQSRWPADRRFRELLAAMPGQR